MSGEVSIEFESLILNACKCTCIEIFISYWREKEMKRIEII